MPKRVLILISLFLSFLIILGGCAQANRKPLSPEQRQANPVEEVSDSEKRVMASRFSNLAKSTDGVQQATVVVSSASLAKKTTSPNSTISPDNDIASPNNPTPRQSPVADSKIAELNRGDTDDPTGTNDPTGTTTTVRTASIVVMLGLTLDSQLSANPDKEKEIKEMVKKKIKDNDGRVREVLVTSNPDMIAKLKDVAAGILDGKAIQSYAQDVNDLSSELRRNQG